MHGGVFKKLPWAECHHHIVPHSSEEDNGKAQSTDTRHNTKSTKYRSTEKFSLKVELSNIRSLYPKHHLVKSHLSNAADVDMLFFTESWLHKNILDSMVSVDGYSLLRHDRINSGGGGVAVYFKQHLKVNQVFPNNAFVTKHSEYLSNFEYLCIDFFIVNYLLGLFVSTYHLSFPNVLTQLIQYVL